MSSEAVHQSRRFAAAVLAIAVTVVLHGGWLADLDPVQRPAATVTA